jgi:beta-lactamase superfamily II metal-dependent hydrolase
MKLKSCFTVLLLSTAVLPTAPVIANDIAPSARVSSAVLVREGPSTNTAIIARLRPGETATLVDQIRGWYIIQLADGTRGYVSKAWTIVKVDASDEPLIAGSHKIHLIDVGTGLAVFVEGPEFALLYDAGSQDDLHGGEENRVVSYIRAVRPDLSRIDHLILSHPHKDHLQLMPAVFDKYQVRNIWESGRVNKTDGYCHFLKAAMAEQGARYHDAIASNATRSVTFTGSGCNGTVNVRQTDMMSGVPVELGATAKMQFLYRDAHPYADPNGNSVVVRLDLGGKRILLAGDSEGGERELPSTSPSPRSIEAKLLDCCASDLKADVLVVGHHGSLTSSRTEFLDAVNASIYAISSGPYPYRKVRLPDPEIVAELESRGQVLRTDRQDAFRIEDEARACEMRERKIGPDADETPGGCDNIVITIAGSGPINAVYSDLVD